MKNIAPLHCLCGYNARDRADASGHRKRCRQVRRETKTEVQRLAGVLGHAPTTADWTRLVDRQRFPSSSWICVNYGGWNPFLRECELEPTHAYDDGSAKPSRGWRPLYYWERERVAKREYGVLI